MKEKLFCKKMSYTLRVLAAMLLCVLMAVPLCMLSGCTKSDWQGTWNRTGDSTYSRAVVDIYDVSARGFYFTMTLYNGNIAGELDNYHAFFTNKTCSNARFEIPDTIAYLDFQLDGKGNINVTFRDEAADIVETEVSHYSKADRLLSDYLGFSAIAFADGCYTREKVEYLNSELSSTGVMSTADSEKVKKFMSEDLYIRLLDCFQTWKVSEHDDEIGGFIYYGSNTMQENGAVIILFDDGTVSVLVSKLDGSLVYYSDNRFYGTGEIMPLPMKQWMEVYNLEQAGEK